LDNLTSYASSQLYVLLAVSSLYYSELYTRYCSHFVEVKWGVGTNLIHRFISNISLNPKPVD